jgi:hypothetical protein
MNKSYCLTQTDSDMWHSIKNKINEDDLILKFLSDKAKLSGMIIIAGVNTVAPIHFGGNAEWQYLFMASKPRSGYLKCLGQYYKIYPNGKIMKKIGKNFIIREVKNG